MKRFILTTGGMSAFQKSLEENERGWHCKLNDAAQSANRELTESARIKTS